MRSTPAVVPDRPGPEQRSRLRGGTGYSGCALIEAWAHGAGVPAAEPPAFMDPPPCEPRWAVAAANAAGRQIRLTGHTRGGRGRRCRNERSFWGMSGRFRE
jgi:hypothetical protein